MSTASGRKAKRRATAAAQKARRQKIFAFVGLGVLAILLVIQGPKMLKLFGGSDTPVAALATTPASAPTEEEKEQALKALPKGSGTDPFATRSLADHDPQAGSISGPSGARDPFVKSGTAVRSTASAAAAPAPVPGRIVVGTPASPDAVAERAWIVVLASIRTSMGRAYAERAANVAKSKRLGTVSVLDSSTRKPLRSGYYVVYTGPFESLSAVQRSAAQVRSSGYRTAYVREILVYSNR